MAEDVTQTIEQEATDEDTLARAEAEHAEPTETSPEDRAVELEAALAERATRIQALEEAQVQREGHRAELEESLAQRDAQVASLQAALEQMEGTLKEREEQIDNVSGQLPRR